MSGHQHRSGKSKQRNKVHKGGGHSSKRSIDRKHGGRVESGGPTYTGAKHAAMTKSNGSSNRQARSNQLAQKRLDKYRNLRVSRRLGVGGGHGTPKVVGFLSLTHEGAELGDLIDRLAGSANVQATLSNGSVRQNKIVTASYSKLKQRFSFTLVPTRTVEACLATVRVCDALVLAVDLSRGPDEAIGEHAYECLTAINASGLPSPIGAVLGLGAAGKRKGEYRKFAGRLFTTELGPDCKLVDGESSDQLLRHIAGARPRPLTWRDRRSHLVAVHTHVKKDEAGTAAAAAAGARTAAEVMAAAGQPLAPEAAAAIREAERTGPLRDSPETVSITVSGYLRGRPLHERQALHIAGIGTFRPGKVIAPPEPFPLAHGADATAKMRAALDAFARGDTLAEAPRLAGGMREAAAGASGPLLASLAPEDTTGGEQTWPTMEEMRYAESGLDEEGMPLAGASARASAPVAAAAGGGGRGGGAASMDAGGEAVSSSSSSSAAASNSSGAVAMSDGAGGGKASGRLSEAERLGKEYEKDFARAWMMGEDDEEEEEDDGGAGVVRTYGDDGFPGEEGEDDEGETAKSLAAAKLAEMEARRALRAEEKEFPDEVETPIDVPASHRFGKFRGLKSESRSEWRTDESLPRSYGRLFYLQNFSRTAARVERVMAAAADKLAGVASSQIEVERAVARSASLAAKSRAAMSRRGASVAGSVMGDRGLAGESVYGGDGDSIYGKVGAGDDDGESVGGMAGDFDARGELDYAGGSRGTESGPASELGSMAGSLASLASSRSTAASTTAALRARAGGGWIASGQFVTIEISGVPAAALRSRPADAPLVVSSLLQHEHVTSVMHYRVSMLPTMEEEDVLKSKDELEFHVGFRSFDARPIFSQERHKSDRLRMSRYMQPGYNHIATVFGPVTFPPGPVLIYRRRRPRVGAAGEAASGAGGFAGADDGQPTLVATGTVLGAAPDKLVLKRVLLTGLPVACKNNKAVVKFMFYNPDDVRWFQKLYLTTKHGLTGNFRGPVGTHGKFKCSFNRVIQPHDTICLSLYKRVFPRWGESYRPLVGDELMSASATDGSYVHALARALGTDASHIGSRAGGGSEEEGAAGPGGAGFLAPGMAVTRGGADAFEAALRERDAGARGARREAVGRSSSKPLVGQLPLRE